GRCGEAERADVGKRKAAASTRTNISTGALFFMSAPNAFGCRLFRWLVPTEKNTNRGKRNNQANENPAKDAAWIQRTHDEALTRYAKTATPVLSHHRQLNRPLALADLRHRRALPRLRRRLAAQVLQLRQDAAGEAVVAAIDARLAPLAHQVVAGQEAARHGHVNVLPREHLVDRPPAVGVERRV